MATQSTGRPVLICYDGSPPAVEAIDYAAALLPGARTAVVTVWKPILEAILAVALGPAPPISDLADADERQRRAAEDVARDGARRGSHAGLEAEPLPIQASGAIWETIERVAREQEARLIVCGTGRGPLTAALPGSVSMALAQHASRPLAIVPSQKAAAERQRRRA
jgi:nucleotide-binding universal stress UspA family protein